MVSSTSGNLEALSGNTNTESFETLAFNGREWVWGGLGLWGGHIALDKVALKCKMLEVKKHKDKGRLKPSHKTEKTSLPSRRQLPVCL